LRAIEYANGSGEFDSGKLVKKRGFPALQAVAALKGCSRGQQGEIGLRT
jgi:hypothetical protein